MGTVLRWERLRRDPTDKSEIVTWRAKVPGGWLVSVWGLRPKPDAKGTTLPDGSNWGGGLTFYPDGKDEWKADIDSADDATTQPEGMTPGETAAAVAHIAREIRR